LGMADLRTVCPVCARTARLGDVRRLSERWPGQGAGERVPAS
jgi:hypothetical protein